MSLLESLILGLVQGLTEFLPVSSSGHLAVIQYLFGVSADNVLVFTVMLHFGTLIAIFIAYWKDIKELIIELFATLKDIFTGKGLQMNKNETRRMGVMIIVTSIPTGFFGICFNDFFEGFYSSMIFIGAALLITGCCLMYAEKKGGGDKDINTMTVKDAFLIGLCQSVAICPGISRSGSTLVGGLLCKFNRQHAVRYAFLISIPPVLGAFLLEVPDAVKSVSSAADTSLGILVAGMVVAAVSGYAAIRIMIKAVTDNKLNYFSYYTWAVGLALIIYYVAA